MQDLRISPICAILPQLGCEAGYPRKNVHAPKCRGKKKPKEEPNSIFDGDKDPNWKPNSKPNDNSIFGDGFNKMRDNYNDWANGPHPYLNNARNNLNNGWNNTKDWLQGDHPYLGPVLMTGAVVGVAATAVFAPEFLPAWVVAF